jgi:asparagine synthase (glutamine-hydrolysing)
MCGIWFYIGDENPNVLLKSFMTIKNRGPETFSFINLNLNRKCYVGFHRLAINGLTGAGNQPFIKDFIINGNQITIYTICNGEIYNYAELMQKHKFPVVSNSDCEILPFLYYKYGKDMIKFLEGEFAFVMLIVNNKTSSIEIYAGRDPYGVRPLFFAMDNGAICFASEAKAIVDIIPKVDVFTPGYYCHMSKELDFFYMFPYVDYPKINSYDGTANSIYTTIRGEFINAVKKRLLSDRPLGCLLSGGLDSSIVSAVTAKFVKNLQTFTIGLEGATDIKYAEMVAKHIGSQHTTFITTITEALEAIDTVIYTIESYDCTSVRASVWQYLLGKKIKETDIKVLLTGEGSDEITGGYMYFHNAPDAKNAHDENVRLIKDIHRFDGLRVDRAMSCHGLEVRIPFLDPDFVNLYLSLPADMRFTENGKKMEKQLFRDAFKDSDLLPEQVLYRKKEAFSDGTSTNEKSWYQIVQEHLNNKISDEEYLKNKRENEDTKEKYYYRKKFVEHFDESNLHLIPYYWLPKWSGDITEPSARVLSCYTNTDAHQE